MLGIKYVADKFLVSTLAACVLTGASSAQTEHVKPTAPPFYVFSNGLKNRSPELGIQLIKKLGYQGVGSVDPNQLGQFKAASEKEGLKVFSVYLGSKVNAENFQYGKDVDTSIQLLKGADALLELNVQRGNNPNDDQAIALVKEIAGKAKEAGLKVVIYPHAAFYIERIDHALKVVKATGCDNVGIAFNLCHFLKVQPNDDLAKTLADAKPFLWSVSTCGADSDGKDWNTLIRPLDEGTFSQATLIKNLRDIGYPNAIGQQCFNIRINPEQNLSRSMDAWRKLFTAGDKK